MKSIEVTVYFEPGTDLFDALQVSEAIKTAISAKTKEEVGSVISTKRDCR